MALAMPERLSSPEVRTSLFYASYYLPGAVQTLLLPIWLNSLGISDEQIGLLAAVPIVAMLFINLIVGRIADKASDWRSVIVVASMFSALASLAFLVVDSYWGIVVVVALCIIPTMAIEPVADAATMRMTRRRGSDFALIRIWGSIGFIVMTGLAGLIHGWLGIGIFVPMFIATFIARGGVSFLLPRFRAPVGDVAPPTSSNLAATTLRQMLRPWFVLALAGGAALQASHMLLMNFGALLWVRAGVPDALLGPLWVIAPICELVVMFYFSRIARRFSARHLLLLACLVAIGRWVGMSMATEIWQFAALQTLHMISFALGYLGVVSFVANWTSDDIAAQAQSFYVVLKQGASVLALLAFGPLVAVFGMGAFWAAAGIAVLGALMVVASLIMKGSKAATVSQ